METKPFYLKQLELSFEQRCRANPHYSMRAYARDLGISVSRLSGVLNGKFGLSLVAAHSLSKVLGYSGNLKTSFMDSVEANHGRSLKSKTLAKERISSRKSDFNTLPLDQFQVISDWQHFAILELSGVMKFKKNDYGRVSKSLQISPTEAKLAIERLLNFDLLRENEDQILESTGSFLANPGGIPNDAIRKHQKQLIERAKLAIDLQSPEERDMRSLTISINREDLPELKKIVTQFQNRFKKRANLSKGKNEVYSLTTQFFRLTNKEAL